MSIPRSKRQLSRIALARGKNDEIIKLLANLSSKEILSRGHPYNVATPFGHYNVPYPIETWHSEAELQAILFCKLRDDSIDARLEVRTAMNRVDIVIFKNQVAVLCIEVKNSLTENLNRDGSPKPVKDTRQRSRYKKLSIPTYYACATDIPMITQHYFIITALYNKLIANR